MKTKIFIQQRDSLPIKTQIARIIQESISEHFCKNNFSLSLLKRVTEYAIETYLHFAADNFCKDYIDYYDFQASFRDSLQTNRLETNHQKQINQNMNEKNRENKISKEKAEQTKINRFKYSRDNNSSDFRFN